MISIDVTLEQRHAAEGFFEAGRKHFDLSKYVSAQFFLYCAGKLYDRVGDKFYRKIVAGWYKSTLKRLGETPSDNPSEWYNKS